MHITIERDDSDHWIKEGKARPAIRHFQIGQLKQRPVVVGPISSEFALEGFVTKTNVALIPEARGNEEVGRRVALQTHKLSVPIERWHWLQIGD